MGKKLRICFGVFWCDIKNICNNKLVHDAYKKIGKNLHSNLHKCTKI
jgi:hypothetical protein